MVDLHYEDFTELTQLEVDRENSIYYAKNTADRNRNRDPRGGCCHEETATDNESIKCAIFFC